MYIQREQLYFSLLYSNGIYKEGTRQEIDAFRYRESLIFENTLYGGEYLTRGIYSRLTQKEREAMLSLILYPPKMQNIFWPSDMVAIQSGEQNPNPLLKLERNYWGNPIQPTHPSYALLFPRLVPKERRTLAQQLKILEQKYKTNYVVTSQWQNYKLEEIQKIAIELVKAIDTLNQNGYLYFDFNMNSIWWQENTVYFDFSNLIYWNPKNLVHQVRIPKLGEFPLEHILPEVFQNTMENTEYKMDETLQNYGLASMLFFLLLGQHPYDGRLRTGDLEDTSFNYENKYWNICREPIFIFDKNYYGGKFDNQPGEVVHFEELKKNWEECPDILKLGFLNALCMKVAIGEKVKRFYDIRPMPPKGWLDSFRELGWIV